MHPDPSSNRSIAHRSRGPRSALVLATLLAVACSPGRYPMKPAPPPSTTRTVELAWLAEPGPIEHRAEVSARWEVGLSGLLDLEHPEAAGLEDRTVPIVLPVHLLVHPEHGLVVVDTGVDRARAAGEHGPVKGLVRGAAKNLEPVVSLGELVDAESAPLSAVLLTHMHIDHVLGLPDVPHEVPVFVGPGELADRSLLQGLLRRTYKQLLADRPPVQTWQVEAAGRLGSIPATDVYGDGSLWALHVPGHTPGSTAYLARSTEGPVLILGDTSHTRWGWDRGVPPGKFTEDPAANQQALDALRGLADGLPGVQVYVGHELDGGPVTPLLSSP